MYIVPKCVRLVLSLGSVWSCCCCCCCCEGRRGLHPLRKLGRPTQPESYIRRGFIDTARSIEATAQERPRHQHRHQQLQLQQRRRRQQRRLSAGVRCLFLFVLSSQDEPRTTSNYEYYCCKYRVDHNCNKESPGNCSACGCYRINCVVPLFDVFSDWFAVVFSTMYGGSSAVTLPLTFCSDGLNKLL